MPAKATMRTATGETPTEAVVGSATEMKRIKDATGRVIGVVKPSALLRYRTMKMLGEMANNGPVMGHAMLVCCVRELDGKPIPQPNSERQIEVMIERLDDVGLNAVAECLTTEFGVVAPTEDAEAVAKN